MTIIVALAALVLVAGMMGAIFKRMFRLAVGFAVVALLLVGAAVFAISTMH